MEIQNTLPNLNHSTLAFEATRVLRNVILAGYFQPGERITEVKLADELNISRATLRHALRDLVGEGLLVSPPRKGAYVVDLSTKDIEDISEVRLALETQAACKLCDTITQEQEQYLRSLIGKMRASPREHHDTELHDLDMQFHEALCKFSGNHHLHQAWAQIGGQLRLYFAASQRKYAFPDFANRHEQLLDAIVLRDKNLRKLIQAHIREGVPLITLSKVVLNAECI